RRALGIDDSTSTQPSVLIKINEAIDAHESPVPIEAHEVHACTPEPLPIEDSDAGQQGNSEPPPEPAHQTDHTPPAESNAPKESDGHAVTLNPGDHSRSEEHTSEL